MNGIVDSLFETLVLWCLEATVLALLAAGICRLLKRQPGNIHAAIWSAAMILTWTAPLAPWIVSPLFELTFDRQAFLNIDVMNPPTLSRPDFHISSNAQASSTDSKNSPNSIPVLQDSTINLSRQSQSEEKINRTPPLFLSIAYIWGIPLLIGIWLLGVSFSFLRWVRSEWNVHRLIARSSDIQDINILNSVERTRQILFIHESIGLRTADAQTAPFVIGLFRPLIFIPQYLIQDWPQRSHQAVIAHELAHVRRYDLATHHAMRLLRVLFWFLPPVWWMQRELHHAQDAACDECAAVVLGSGFEFGQALTQLAERCLIFDPAFPALGVLHSKPSLIIRLENIVNAQLSHLSRLSLKWKIAILAVSCVFFFFVGTTKLTLSQPTFSATFLGSYSGEPNSLAIEKIVYAPPYYAIIGLQNDQRVIQYYRYDNKNFLLHHELRLTPNLAIPSDMHLSWAVAKESRLVLCYGKKDDYLFFSIASQDENAKPFNLSIPSTSKTQKPCLQGDYLYFMTVNQDKRLCRYNLCPNIANPLEMFAPLPRHIEWNDFAPWGEEILLSDFSGDDENNPSPSANGKPGVARARIKPNNQLEIDKERWFTDNNQTYVNQIIVQNDTIFVYRFDNRTDQGEVLIVDGSNRESPRIVQTIGAGQFGELWVFGDALSIRSYTIGGKSQVTTELYQRKEGRYQKTAQFSEESGSYVLGADCLIRYKKDSIQIYDIAAPESPLENGPQFTPALQLSQIVSVGLYFYTCMNGNLVSFDSAIPFSPIIEEKYSLPEDKNVSLQAHDSILSIFYRDSGLKSAGNKTILFAILDDGKLGEIIQQPSYPTNKIYSRIGEPLYNEKIYIQPVYYPQPNGRSKPDPAYPELYLYNRADGKIGSQPMGAITLPAANQQFLLAGDRLYELRTENRMDEDGFGRRFIQETTLYLYSVENPTRPLYLSKFVISHD